MPLYEYRCRTCGHRFETLVFGQAKPRCPECDGKDLDRLLSAFAVSGGCTIRGDTGSWRSSSGGCSSAGGG